MRTIWIALLCLGCVASAQVKRPRILGLAHVGLRVHDMQSSRHFYEDFLGYAEVFSLPPSEGKGALVCIKVNDRQYIELNPEANQRDARSSPPGSTTTRPGTPRARPPSTPRPGCPAPLWTAPPRLRPARTPHWGCVTSPGPISLSANPARPTFLRSTSPREVTEDEYVALWPWIPRGMNSVRHA